MLSLYVIANILFIGFASASLANLYDDCLQDGMIFSRLGAFLQLEIRLNQKRKVKKVKVPFWKMPVGGCIICTNAWIAVLMSILYLVFPTIFIVFAVLGISNTCLKFIIK